MKKTTISPAISTPSEQMYLAGSRLPGLDGLRALAVILVLAFHLTPGAVIGGYLGVDVFFVISGFLITSLLLHERRVAGRIHLGEFWRRRARRLLPALGVLLLVVCAAALAVGGDPLLGLARQVLGAATFSSNWVFIAEGASYFSDSAPALFRNIWSLALEEQFYLVWPLLLMLIVLIRSRRIRLGVLIASVIASALAMAVIYHPDADATRVYYGADTHSFGLAIGAALGILSERWPRHRLAWSRWSRFTLPTFGWVAVGAIIALATVMPDDSPFVYRGGLVLVSALTAVAIVGGIVPGSWLGRVIDLQPLRWIGQRSYGLYLWHWPVFVLIAARFPALDSTPVGGWILGGTATVITVLAAALSYRFVEQPIRLNGFRASLGRFVVPWRRGRRAVVAATVALLLVAGTGTATTVALLSDPGRSELESRLAHGQAAIARATTPQTPEESPQLPGGGQISAIGDSVMLAAAPQLEEAFPGIAIDAVVSRQMRAAPAAVQALLDAGTLRPTLLLGLGTNGYISADTLDQVKALVGRDTEIVLVNVQAPREWVPEVNAILARYAQQSRSIELANWHDAIQPSIGELASDEVHPGGPISAGIYVAAIRDALQRFAELPPLLDNNDYGLAPRPV